VLNDKASGIYNAFYCLGAIIAPILGGILNDHIGYRLTNDVMAFVCMGFAVIYILSNTRLADYKILKSRQKTNEDDRMNAQLLKDK
jgi:MFS family permease